MTQKKKVYYDEITLTTVLYDSFRTCLSVKVGARKCVTVRKFMTDVNFDSLCHSEYGKKTDFPLRPEQLHQNQSLSYTHAHTNKHTPVSGI